MDDSNPNLHDRTSTTSGVVLLSLLFLLLIGVFLLLFLVPERRLVWVSCRRKDQLAPLNLFVFVRLKGVGVLTKFTISSAGYLQGSIGPIQTVSSFPRYFCNFLGNGIHEISSALFS
jgi:Na+/serine symporter